MLDSGGWSGKAVTCSGGCSPCVQCSGVPVTATASSSQCGLDDSLGIPGGHLGRGGPGGECYGPEVYCWQYHCGPGEEPSGVV